MNYYFDFGSIPLPVLIPATLALLFSAFVSLADYLIRAFGLYKASKNTGIKYPWLAFIPIGDMYLIGRLADRYNYNNGKKTSFAPILIFLQVIIFIMMFALPPLTELIQFKDYIPQTVTILLLATLALILVASLASTVLLGVSYYFLYKDFEPSRVILYTVLSVLGLGCIPLILIRNNVPVGMAGKQDPLQPKFK